MTYFPDLDTYSYVWSGPNVRAVGWLSAEHEFTRGAIDRESLAVLREHVATAYEIMISMGVHRCEFCDRERGSKNLMIPTESVVYIAPGMITHYIEVHGYQPPAEFLTALMKCPRQNSPEYLRLMSNIQSSPISFTFGGGQLMG